MEAYLLALTVPSVSNTGKTNAVIRFQSWLRRYWSMGVQSIWNRAGYGTQNGSPQVRMTWAYSRTKLDV